MRGCFGSGRFSDTNPLLDPKLIGKRLVHRGCNDRGTCDATESAALRQGGRRMLRPEM